MCVRGYVHENFHGTHQGSSSSFLEVIGPGFKVTRVGAVGKQIYSTGCVGGY